MSLLLLLNSLNNLVLVLVDNISYKFFFDNFLFDEKIYSSPLFSLLSSFKLEIYLSSSLKVLFELKDFPSISSTKSIFVPVLKYFFMQSFFRLFTKIFPSSFKIIPLFSLLKNQNNVLNAL